MKTLKKILTAIFAFALLGMATSCNKDDNNKGNGGDGNFVGTWKISKIMMAGMDVTSMIPADARIIMNADGSGNMTMGGDNHNPFNWTATSTTLTITTEGETINCNIISFTANECTLSSDNMTFPNMDNIEGTVTITLTRVGGGDNPDPNNYSTLILGTWQVTQTFVDGEDVSVDSVQLSFTANGRGLLNDHGETQNNDFSWSINGSTISINPDHGSSATFTIVSLDGRTCTFTGTRMPGSDENYNEVRITMVKTGGDDPDPTDPLTSLTGTQWGFEYSTTMPEEGGQLSIDANLTINFTSATEGITGEHVHFVITQNGVIVDEDTEEDSAPFTYTYNGTTHTGTMTATITDEDGTHTININIICNSSNTLTIINPDSRSRYPQNMVFHRL